jgi:arylsulfatase A-like enzyme
MPLRYLLALTAAGVFMESSYGRDEPGRSPKPNVLIVITDDQGYGDLGCHGNPVIKTPVLDRFAGDSVRLKHFYVCPVCSPTRSALLTGRYNYRTGVVDTFIGRSMMRPDETTLAQMLGAAGYRTGLFGKWHLGDNYPLRPHDRGFQECLWHKGGGIAQPSDPPEGNSYFDPSLLVNGKPIKARGYCSDVFTEAAIRFATADPSKPFFAYVAYNCPHGPFQVADELAAPYKKLDLTPAGFPKVGQPWATPKVDTDQIAKAYGMVENIDTNLGRMFQALANAKIADNTLVLFMTDNGPGGVRFNSGLRARKGTVYEGGIRVPGYVRWPAGLKPGREVEQAAAHIDIVPTVLDACGVKKPDGVALDGRSLLPLLKGEKPDWPDRTLYLQWHRGDEPELYRAFTARGPRYKLVQAQGAQPGPKDKGQKFELFDLANDPFEQTDLADKMPEKVAEMKAGYGAWFKDVTKKGFAPPRIHLGSDKENPVQLTRQDWRGPKASWAADGEGYWEVFIEREGPYRITLRSKGKFDQCGYALGGFKESLKLPAAAETQTVTRALKKGDWRLEAWVEAGGRRRGVEYVDVEYIGEK